MSYVFACDQLSSWMHLVVELVLLAVFFYSGSYLRSDPALPRFCV